MEKLLFIYNPHAGTGKIKNKLSDIIDIFTKAGFSVTAYPTQATHDAANVLNSLAQRCGDGLCDLIVCCGGDGTLDEVVGGLMKQGLKIPLGYIPAGTTNDFAKNLEIPSDMLKAAEQICQRRPFVCDIGHFNEKNFVYIAAFGLFTDVSYETNQDVKNMIGHTAYLLEGIRRLPDLKASRMRIVSDNIDMEDEFLFGMVTNSVSVGGFKRITGERIKLDDGLFEVTLIRKPKNPFEQGNLLTNLMTRKFNADCMHWFKASRLDISAPDAVAWTLDGEFGGLHNTVTIENIPRAVEFYC